MAVYAHTSVFLIRVNAAFFIVQVMYGSTNEMMSVFNE